MDEERSYMSARLIVVGLLFVAGFAILGILSKTKPNAGLHIGGPAFRLLASTWITLAGLMALGVFMREPRRGPVTWAAAMAGALGIFGLLLLAYGSVPHEWLTYADSVLKWREDKMFLKHGKDVLGLQWPIDITGRAVRDVIATLIYIVFFGLQLALWVRWQNVRKGATPARPRAAVPAPAGTSAFGRPVVKQN